MGEGTACRQRQGGFRGPAGKFCSKHRWNVPLCRGQEFDTRQADGTCPRQQGAPAAGSFPLAETSWPQRGAREAGCPAPAGRCSSGCG